MSNSAEILFGRGYSVTDHNMVVSVCLAASRQFSFILLAIYYNSNKILLFSQRFKAQVTSEAENHRKKHKSNTISGETPSFTICLIFDIEW